MLVRGIVIAGWTTALLSAANPAAVPQLQSSFPLSLTRGQTAELVVRGSNLESATGVLSC